MRKRVLAVVCAIALFCVNAFATAIDDFKANPAVNAASTSVMIIDLRTGKTVAAMNENTPLLPASIMKSLTIASLMHHTEADDRFITEVWMEGPVRNGVLQGNLVVVGAGDPTINSRYEPKSAEIVSEIVQALKKKGIKEIS